MLLYFHVNVNICDSLHEVKKEASKHGNRIFSQRRGGGIESV